MASKSPRTVMCFGDSNTHGTRAIQHLGDRRRFDGATRWPGVMAAELGADWHVIEEGHPGRTTVHDDPIEGAHKNGLAALPALLESHRPLDLVIVMLGTNDLKARFSVGATDIAASVRRLGEVVRATPAGPDGDAPDLMIVSPVPIRERGILEGMFDGGEAKSQALAPLLAEVADDLRAGFVDAGKLTKVSKVDGIHLTAKGQTDIGEGMAKAVRKRMK